jgi:hypothetical protein
MRGRGFEMTRMMSPAMAAERDLEMFGWWKGDFDDLIILVILKKPQFCVLW